MSARLLRLILTLLLPSVGGCLPAYAQDALAWTELPALPGRLGVAGAFAGVDGGALIVAGGANFPGQPPWEGGVKEWHDEVYLLDARAGEWRVAGRLPGRLGYGGAISTSEGLICLGGSDAERHHAEVFRIKAGNGSMATEGLPPLPLPCANLAAAMLGRTIYVAGGIEEPGSTEALRTFWALDLAEKAPRWRELDPWPGPGRMLAVAGVQDGAFYLMSGVALGADAEGKPVRRYLNDAYRYRPGRGWARLADLPRAAAAAPTPALAVGQATLLVMGGDDGSLVDFTPLAEHPGFPRTTLAYHTIMDTWHQVGVEQPISQVTTTGVEWRGRYVVPSGEIRPGVRTPRVLGLQVSTPRAGFGAANYLIIGAYLGAMVGIGFVCSRRNKSTDDFFRGGQRIPWWAAGLSIFATMLSSITFMAIPAAAYADGWNLFLANSYVLITPLVVLVFLPFYRRLNVTTAYEYLEERFNLTTRLAGSLLFMLYQCGRIAIVLYLPALALATVSDLSITTSILVMGVLCVAYTVAGGIEAVIWTDVVQAVLLLGGALFSLGYLLTRIDGGLAETVRVAAAGRHFFETVTWDLDLAVASGWVILVGSLFHNLFPYTASQDVVQRYLTTRDQKSAARGIWLNAALAVPAQAVFFAIGTGLYVFYTQRPARLDPTLRNDAIFPFFIMRELPVGVAGLIVAGIFAAAQSTLSSSMNSIATAYVTDFHRRLRPGLADRDYLLVARVATVLVGVLGTAAALFMAASDIRTVYSIFLEVLGLLGGTLSGLFLLGIFSLRASGGGAIAGALASAVVVFTLRSVHPLNVYAYAPIGIMTCVVVGWLASVLLFPERGRDLEGLTIHGLGATSCKID